MFAFVVLLGCVPPANDFVLASVRFAEATAPDLPVSAQLERLEQLVADYPWFHTALWTAAETEMARQNWTAAYSAYKRLNLEAAHTSDRATVAQRLATLEERSPALRLYSQAEIASAKNDWDGAARLLHQALDAKPNFAIAHLLLAKVLSRLDRCGEAMTAVEHYVSLEAKTRQKPEAGTLISDCRDRLGMGHDLSLIDPYADEPQSQKKRGKKK